MRSWCNGSHAGLRSQWRNPWEFESPRPHQPWVALIGLLHMKHEGVGSNPIGYPDYGGCSLTVEHENIQFAFSSEVDLCLCRNW